MGAISIDLLRMENKFLNFYARLKESAFIAGCCCAVFMLESCYSTTVSVGNMNASDPAVEVNTAHNGHFIMGLVNATKVEDDVYVGDNKNYVMKTYTSVGDAVVTGVTMGLFAPTTTKFYLPYGSEMPPKVHMPPVQFGVRAGLNFPSHTGHYGRSGSEESIEGKMGIKLGLVADVPMTPSVYFQPGIYYSKKGAKQAAQNYIEMPFLLSYRFGVPNILESVTNGNEFTKDMHLQVLAGPYIGAAYDNDLYTKRFDYGIQLGIGAICMKHFYFGLSYDIGLQNYHVNERYYNNSSDYKCFSINFGYNL